MTNNNEKEMLRLLTTAVTGIQKLDERVANLEKGQTNLEKGQAEIKEDISEIKTEIKLINRKISIIDNEQRSLRGRVEILEDKIQPSN